MKLTSKFGRQEYMNKYHIYSIVFWSFLWMLYPIKAIPKRKGVFHQRFCSLKGHLPPMVIVHRRLFHKKSYSIKSLLCNGIFHSMFSFRYPWTRNHCLNLTALTLSHIWPSRDDHSLHITVIHISVNLFRIREVFK